MTIENAEKVQQVIERITQRGVLETTEDGQTPALSTNASQYNNEYKTCAAA
jgi:hypothetical protein